MTGPAQFAFGRSHDTSARNSRYPDCGSSGVPFSTAQVASGVVRQREKAQAKIRQPIRANAKSAARRPW